MYELQYPATIVRDEAGYYLVTFPDLPEAATDAESEEDALAEAVDALDEAISGRMNRGDDIPHPSIREGASPLIPVPLPTALKAAIYNGFKESGMDEKEFARRLGAKPQEVRRLLDPHGELALPWIDKAMSVLGHRLVVGVV